MTSDNIDLTPKLLIDKTRLQEIYDLRVHAWENSNRCDLVNRELFPNGWTDKLDDSAFHFIVEKDNKIIAAARLNICNSLDELVEKEIFEQFELPVKRPFAFYSRLVVSPNYRNLGLSSKLDRIRHLYALEMNTQFSLVSSGDVKRVNSLLKKGWTVLGKVQNKYHSESSIVNNSCALIRDESDEISIWGRTLSEYNRMFSFDFANYSKKVLSVADGPASFNYEMKQIGKSVTSLDPIYAFNKAEVEDKIKRSAEKMVEKLKNKKTLFAVQDSKIDDLISRRFKAMNLFINDYELGKIEGRYLSGELPHLPFSDKSFDICICSNLLFLFEEYFSEETHIDSIKEMLRVANEARMFPLHNRKGNESRHLKNTLSYFSKNYNVKITEVDYEVYKNGNKMLIISP